MGDDCTCLVGAHGTWVPNDSAAFSLTSISGKTSQGARTFERSVRTNGFEGFCQEVRPHLLNVPYSHVGDAVVAEGLAQEALVRAWVYRPSISEAQRKEAWTFRCAINLVNSWHRRRRIE